MNAVRRDRWMQRHRFCADTPPPIESLEHAWAVLAEHGDHDENCLQLPAALNRVSGVT